MIGSPPISLKKFWIYSIESNYVRLNVLISIASWLPWIRGVSDPFFWCEAGFKLSLISSTSELSLELLNILLP